MQVETSAQARKAPSGDEAHNAASKKKARSGASTPDKSELGSLTGSVTGWDDGAFPGETPAPGNKFSEFADRAGNGGYAIPDAAALHLASVSTSSKESPATSYTLSKGDQGPQGGQTS